MLRKRWCRRVTLVAIVLVVGILIGVADRVRVFEHRAHSNGLRAREYARRAVAHAAAADDCEAFGGDEMLRVAREYRAMAQDERRLAKYHARLEQRYRRRQLQPWTSLAADTPE